MPAVARLLHRSGPSHLPDDVGSADYWEARYAAGEDSGGGSFGRLARFKAETINAFVAERGVRSVIEFGCGDGNQIRAAKYASYRGYDVSPTAIARCRKRFGRDPSKSFALLADYRGERADLVLSLDVIFHLVEDEVFAEHLRQLFEAAERFVIIYSSNVDDESKAWGSHIVHREFTRRLGEYASAWRLVKRIPNRYPYRGPYLTGSFSDFFVFERPAS